MKNLTTSDKRILIGWGVLTILCYILFLNFRMSVITSLVCMITVMTSIYASRFVFSLSQPWKIPFAILFYSNMSLIQQFIKHITIALDLAASTYWIIKVAFAIAYLGALLFFNKKYIPKKRRSIHFH